MSEVLRRLRNTAGIIGLAGAVMIGAACSGGDASPKTGPETTTVTTPTKPKATPSTPTSTQGGTGIDKDAAQCSLDALSVLGKNELSGHTPIKIAMGFRFYDERTENGVQGTEELSNPAVTVCKLEDGSSL